MVKLSIIIPVDNTFSLLSNFFSHLLKLDSDIVHEYIVVLDGCKNIDVINYIKQIENTKKT